VIIRKRISWNYCESQVIVRYEIVQITFQVNYVLVVVALLYLTLLACQTRFHINGAVKGLKMMIKQRDKCRMVTYYDLSSNNVERWWRSAIMCVYCSMFGYCNFVGV